RNAVRHAKAIALLIFKDPERAREVIKEMEMEGKNVKASQFLIALNDITADDLKRPGVEVETVMVPGLASVLKQRAVDEVNLQLSSAVGGAETMDDSVMTLTKYLGSCEKANNNKKEAGARILVQNHLQTIQYIIQETSGRAEPGHLILMPEVLLASNRGENEAECFTSADENTLTYITGAGDYVVGYVRGAGTDTLLDRLTTMDAVSPDGTSFSDERILALSALEVKRRSGEGLKDDLPQAIAESLLL
ncbi:hypothetical protein FRB99_003281, partial [Tulasnella sp. 403]